MAIGGTGLPLPKTGDVLTQPAPVIDGDKYSSARAWMSMAQSGEKIAAAGLETLSLEEHQRKAKAVADFEVDHADFYTKLRDQYAKDPVGYENAARAHNEGAISNVDRWMVPHAQKFLGGRLEGGMAAILSEKRGEDQRLSAQSLDARSKMADNDVMALATVGKIGSPEFEAAKQTYLGVLDTAVSTRLMSPDKKDFLVEDLISRATGENAARTGVEVYRTKGFDEAVGYLRTNILDNEGLSLKIGARQQAFDRGMKAIRLEQQQDRQDKVGITQEAGDLIARVKSRQPYDASEIRDMSIALARVGAVSQLKTLSIEHAVAQQTQDPGASWTDRASVVAANRVGVQSARAQEAMQFFQSKKGYTQAQAAGIVGNLVQENPTFDPSQLHDKGTGIGIAGWRLERRMALRSFATTRGTTENDWPTQLEFIAHELETTESATGAKLKAATTPQAAAEAFVGFERPQGYTPANPRAAHGYINRVGNAVLLAQTPADPNAVVPDAGTSGPYAGQIAARVQTQFVADMRKAWPEFKAHIDSGKPLDEADFQALRMAAALSKDAAWHKQVEDLALANRIGQNAAEKPLTNLAAISDRAQAELGTTVGDSIKKQLDRRQKLLKDEPVSYAIEQGQRPPDPLDLSSTETATKGVQQRALIARSVAEQQQVPVANPFRPAEVTAIAGAIVNGKAQQASAAFEALASLPDDMMGSALSSAEIKQAITGATRSADPARYQATMSFMDRMWQRAPEAAKHLFGEDSVHALMTWQSNQRYMTGDQLAEDRKKAALDPQQRGVMSRAETEGNELARKFTFDDIAHKFDTSWWITPGPVARAIGSQPLAPTDMLTRDAMMGDFQTIYARRYAETRDKDKATEQTVELMKTKWTASPVNGGRLMLNAPETLRDPKGNPVYPAINGSYDWMNKQVEASIASVLGTRKDTGYFDLQPRHTEFDSAAGTPMIRDDPGGFAPTRNWSYTLISDNRTQAEAQNGIPGSYQVAVTDAQTGRITVLPQRFRFDPSDAQGAARTDFQAQRRRVLEAPEPASPGYESNLFGGIPRGSLM